MNEPVLTPAPARRFWLCADDYGISPGVDNAIRDLIARGRLNATSVMVVPPAFGVSEAATLADLNSKSKRAAIGLHLTFTAPFRPLSDGYEPLDNGAFLSLGQTTRRSWMRQLRPEKIAREVAAQIAAFKKAFGRTPDFVDGHQHAHLFPQIRESALRVVKEMAPGAWMRQCGRAAPRNGWLDPKALFLDHLSRGFRRQAQAVGVRTNPAFAGVYDLKPQSDFPRLFASFLTGLPDGGVVMCHPGFVDDELKRVDPVLEAREREYAFLAGDAFPALLKSRGFALA
ncbi:MAG: ChbG/HpnK family deacetylase [Pseudorhodoplanes sp.]